MRSVFLGICLATMADACFGQGAIIFSSGQSQMIAPFLPPVYQTYPRPPWSVPPPGFIASDPGTVVTTVPAPSTEPRELTIRVWDNSGGPVTSWDVTFNPALINSLVQLPPMPWLYQTPNWSSLLSFSASLSEAGLSSDSGFVGPLPDTTAVPEPASIGLIGLGAAVIFWRKAKGRVRGDYWMNG